MVTLWRSRAELDVGCDKQKARSQKPPAVRGPRRFGRRVSRAHKGHRRLQQRAASRAVPRVHHQAVDRRHPGLPLSTRSQRSPPITTARRLARRPSSTPPSGRRHPGLPLSTRSNRVAALFEIISSRETSESGDAKHLAADPRTILGRETPVRVRDPEHGGVPVADSRREYYT